MIEVGCTYKNPKKHEQRLLRNIGVHHVILDLLQIPFDHEDDQMIELMQLAHKFLQNFCLENFQNQAILYKKLDLFLNPGKKLLLLLFL